VNETASWIVGEAVKSEYIALESWTKRHLIHLLMWKQMMMRKLEQNQHLEQSSPQKHFQQVMRDVAYDVENQEDTRA
jgi:hypothetical protein